MTGLVKLSYCRVPIGTQFGYTLTITLLRAVFLRDVAASRHSSNKFGSALDFRNVIHISPLRGDTVIISIRGFSIESWLYPVAVFLDEVD